MNEEEVTRRLSGMTKLGRDASGWRTLFKYGFDKSLWKVTYEQGEMHGGGTRQLTPITAAEAVRVYGLEAAVLIANRPAEVEANSARSIQGGY